MEVLYMKKLLTSLFLTSALGIGTLSAGEVYFKEDFETDLSKWTTVDVDGLNMHANAYDALGLDAPAPLSWIKAKASSTNSVALSCSYYDPAGTANDWLISQEFEIGENAVLEWTASASSAGYADGYKVYISTTGTGQVSDFTTELFSIAAENGDDTRRFVDLSKLNYKNQKIRIAFRNNSEDKFFLFLDDVVVHVPTDYDIKLAGAFVAPYFKVGSSSITQFPVVVTNESFKPLTSFDLTYKIDGEEPVTTTITKPELAYHGTNGFFVTTPWSPATLGNRKITFSVSNINGTGVADPTPENNSADFTTNVWDNTVGTDLFPLYESFTSSTCGPCAQIGTIFNPILDETKDKMALIKYQMSWPSPGDPYYNADGGLRKTYYAVNSVPMAFSNGTKYSLGGLNLTQFGLDLNAMSRPATYEILNPTYTITDRKVTVKADLKAYVDNTGKTVTAHIGVFEFKTTGNKSTNGETEFHHVMHKMLPNGNGTNVTAITKDATQALTESYEFPATAKVEEMSDLGVVIFLQDKTGKTILQSAYAVKSEPSSVPYVEDGNGVVGLYPNPATTSAHMKYSVNGDRQVNIELFDLSGNSVYRADKGVLNTGYYNENFNLTDLANGQYFVRLNIGGRMFTEVITISK